MIAINIHLSAPMKIKVTQLDKCVTLALSSDGNEVVYFLNTMKDVRAILNTTQKALDQLILGFVNHKRLVAQLHLLMDEASVEYDQDEDVVDDFTQYVKDWADRRSEASLDRAKGI